MSVIVNEIRCPKDHVCPAIRFCPADAITQNAYGLPVIDKSKCTECGVCTRVCPRGALQVK